jgi:hypothetical protein
MALAAAIGSKGVDAPAPAGTLPLPTNVPDELDEEIDVPDEIERTGSITEAEGSFDWLGKSCRIPCNPSVGAYM